MKKFNLWLIITIFSFPFILKGETVEVDTPSGKFKVRIYNEKIKKEELSDPRVVYSRIIEDIRIIRNNFISKLYSHRDRRRAMTIIDEIEDLLNLLYYQANFSQYLEVTQDSSSIGQSTYQTNPPGYNLMSPYKFNAFLSQLDSESFSEDKLNLLKVVASNNYFTVEQLSAIMDRFPMDEDKIKAVEILYPRVIDPENSYLLLNKVTFSKSKERLRRIISSH